MSGSVFADGEELKEGIAVFGTVDVAFDTNEVFEGDDGELVGIVVNGFLILLDIGKGTDRFNVTKKIEGAVFCRESEVIAGGECS